MNFLITLQLLCTIESNKHKYFPRSVCVRHTQRQQYKDQSGKYGLNSKDDVGRLASIRYVFLAFGSWFAAFMTPGGNLPMLYDFEPVYSNLQATGFLLHKAEILVFRSKAYGWWSALGPTIGRPLSGRGL